MSEGKFKEQLLKTSLLKIIRMLIIVSIVFIFGFLAVTMANNEFEARNNLEMMQSFFESNYDHAKEFLILDSQQNLFKQVLRDDTSKQVLEGKLNQYNNNNAIRANSNLI